MDYYLTLKIEIWTATGTSGTSRRAMIRKHDNTPYIFFRSVVEL